MKAKFATPLWMIEGYYGAPWPDQARLTNYGLLGQWGYDCAIYAPKAARVLRREWRRPLLAAEEHLIAEMAQCADTSGLGFGVGLSPIDCWRDWSPEARHDLRAKLDALAACGCEALCLLFDDMRGDVPRLGLLQAQIAAFVRECWRGEPIVLCPTYYSDDPILERVFGPAPERYLEELGGALEPEFGIFWTGPKVISETITAAHIAGVTARLGRKPFLWDNYPVNDGATTSRYLYLGGVSGRTEVMSGLLAGYAANPMLQPHLSQIPLRALASLARDPSTYSPQTAFLSAVRECVGPHTVGPIIRFARDFATRGLDGLSDEETKRVLEVFDNLKDPHAREVREWLRNTYLFDPMCLTD